MRNRNDQDDDNSPNDEQHDPDGDSHKESLLTPKSLQLSITAPRCPPYFTAQRSLLVGRPPRPETDPYYLVAHSGSSSSNLTSVSSEHWNDRNPHHHERVLDHHVFSKEKRKKQRRSKEKISATTMASSPFHKTPHHHHNNNNNISMPHPHLPSLGPDRSSQATRLLGTVLPLQWQNQCRDAGGFRWIADSLVQVSLPLAALTNPTAARQFVRLSQQCRRVRYGNDSDDDDDDDNSLSSSTMQYMDVFLPDMQQQHQQQQRTSQQKLKRGMVFFVHGGAWGSGLPWFYRLVATPFLQQGLAVAIVGYRVYPVSKTVQNQVDDLQAAWEVLADRYAEWCGGGKTKQGHDDNVDVQHPHLGTIVMGHSSGAHIALLWLVDRAKRQWMQTKQQHYDSNDTKPNITAFVGISGPYNIDHHFDYEAARGVEEISPLKAVNGFTRQEFLRNSPAWRLQNALTEFQEAKTCSVQDFFPRRMLLIHGIEDDTVPFTATSEVARALRACGVVNCEEVYVPETGHQDAVVHLMLGGRVRNAIVKWLLQRKTTNESSSLLSPRSRL